MTEQNRAEMNRFSQANTPFIALLSYDEPKKDIVCEISEAEKLGLKFKFDAKFKGKISYKFKKFPLKFKIYHKAFKKVQDVMKNSDLIDCSLFSYKTRKFRNFKILKSDVSHKRKFLDIKKIIFESLDNFASFKPLNLEEIFEMDKKVREFAKKLV